MRQGKRILRVFSRIGYPEASGYSTANRSFLSWSGFAKIFMKRVLFHRSSLRGWFIHSFLVLPSFQGKLILGNGHYKLVRRGPTLSGVGGVIEHKLQYRSEIR